MKRDIQRGFKCLASAFLFFSAAGIDLLSDMVIGLGRLASKVGCKTKGDE